MIQALVAENTFYLNSKDLQTIVQEVCFVNGETEVGVMLDFYHDLGMIVKHGNTVVLQAQWLIDLFKQLITIPRYKDVVRNKSYMFSLLCLSPRFVMLNFKGCFSFWTFSLNTEDMKVSIMLISYPISNKSLSI